MHLWDDNDERSRVHRDLNSRYSNHNSSNSEAVLKYLFTFVIVSGGVMLLFENLDTIFGFLKTLG